MKYDTDFTKEEIEAYELKFAEWRTLIGLCYIPSGIAFFLLSYFSLVALNRLCIASDGISGYHLSYQSAVWFFLPLFGSLSLCVEITMLVWTIFVGWRVVHLYCQWESLQPKRYRGSHLYYDSRKVMNKFALFIAVPIGLATVLALGMHTTFTQDGIYEYGYAFKAPVFHSYRDVRHAALLEGFWGKHQKFIHKPSLVLDFSDGSRWAQTNWDDSNKEATTELIAILRKHTQVPIEDKFTVEELPVR
jgi:hypothetical protein